MLRKLYIRNFTLIDELDINFNPGFSVITGETGAGKSIILGAIGLLLGNRADAKQVKEGTKKCIVEAVFDVGHDRNNEVKNLFEENDLDFIPDECILRREVSANGKSRAFINDTPITLALMRELGEHLIDIHSQHQNLLLGKENFQLNVIDILAHDANELSAYREAYKRYTNATASYAKLQKELSDNAAEADFLRFQQNELASAHLDNSEQEELEQRAETMSHAEEIKGNLYSADTLLNGDENGIVGNLRSVMTALNSISKVFPKADELAQRLESSRIEISDIADEIASCMEEIDFDPREMQQINDRLDLIYSLQHKYHVDTVEALNDYLATVNTKLNNIDTGEEQLETQAALVEQTKTECERLASALSKLRSEAAKTAEQEMLKRLVPLGIPKVRFEVDIASAALGVDGTDKITFLFSANSSSPMQPVSQVASGGEIARVMLSLKAMIGNAVELPTIIFDEIDTGVSGRVAEQMARIMKEMGGNDRQVISITHLPQIAALGSTHYKVAKTETDDGTSTRMTLLEPEERVKEIAQMLSGSEITQAATDNARELLKKQ